MRRRICKDFLAPMLNDRHRAHLYYIMTIYQLEGKEKLTSCMYDGIAFVTCHSYTARSGERGGLGTID